MAGPCCAGAGGGAGGGAAGWLGLLLGLPALLAAAFARAPMLTAVVAGPIIVALLAAYPLLLYLTPVRREALEPELSYRGVDRKTGVEYTAKLPHLVTSSGQVSPAEVDLTVVVPAYNETSRLKVMLDDALSYLEGAKSTGDGNGHSNGFAGSGFPQTHFASPPSRYEIVIVDDGSKDGTAQLALEYAKEKMEEGKLAKGEIRVVTLQKNRGKGGAVRHGVLHSRGELILFADADGATRFGDLHMLLKEMERICTPAGHGVVVGSRAHLVGTEATVKRSFIRNLLMHGFHMLLALLLRPPSPSALLRQIPLIGLIFAPSQKRRRPREKRGPESSDKTSDDTAKDGSNGGNIARQTSLSSILSLTGRESLPVQPEIRDTQCGFKLFTRQTAATVFPLAHIERWIFDVELLLLAEMASKKSLSTRLACEGSVLEERRRLSEMSGHMEKEGEEEEAEDPLLDLPVPIAEVAVHWEEVGGSKIDLLRDSIGMAVDLLVIRANYAIGTTWKSPEAVPIRRQEVAK